MKIEELETRLKTQEEQIKALQDALKIQNRSLQNLQDIEDIKKLQRCYGYYLERGMMQEVKDLFADGPEVSTHWLGKGSYLGPERAKGAWDKNFTPEMVRSQEFLHLIMQLSGIVNVDPDGQTARGRWYAWAAVAIPMRDKIMHEFGVACYENEYVKQNGKWKIKIINCRMVYIIRNPKEGFVKPERFVDINADPKIYMPDEPDFDNPEKYDEWQYPSRYILPFHFNHPVTGKETCDKARNASIKQEKDQLKNY
jgi:hypothetical protein